MRSRSLFALIASIVIAGCSAGANGGGVLGGLPVVGGTQDPNTDAQSAAQAAMSPVGAGDLTSGLINGTYGATLAAGQKVVSMTTPVCRKGRERIITVISSDETQYETKYFYDAACTELAKDVVADVTIPTSSTESIVRTATWFNQSGTQLANRNANFNITGSPGNFTAILNSAFYVGSSTQATNQFGGEFAMAQQNATTYAVSGNHGDVYNDVRPRVDQSFGVAAALQNVTASVDGSGDVTFTGSRDITLSVGPLYGLTLSSTPPFTVSGGSTLGNGTAAGTVEFDANGDLIDVNMTVNTVRGFTVVMTSSGTPIAINGTVTNSGGSQVATFTVDQFGDGVITYANGNQALIIDWRIVG